LDGNSAGVDIGDGATANPGNGGGLHISAAGVVTVRESTVDGNTAANEGGGLWGSGAGLLTIERSTISNNSAPDGGGLFLQAGASGMIELTNSTVSNNSATNGGGVQVEGGWLTALNATIAANSASNMGGGINDAGGAINLANTIVADNSAPTGPDVSGTIDLSLSSLVEDASGASGIMDGNNGNIVGQDPMLMPLADNGGPTLTHMPAPNSPVVDAGDTGAASLLETDQRGEGFPRFVDGDGNGTDVVDIGAVELQNGEGQIVVNTFQDLPLDPNDGFLTLREAIIRANNTPGADTINLNAGTYTLSISGDGENMAQTGDLDITDELTITGEGVTISANNLGDRVFDVRPDASLTLDGLTITGGMATNGGGIRNEGTLVVMGSVLTNNTATNDGGAIWNASSGSLTIRNTTIVNNSAVDGAGVYTESAGDVRTFTVDLSTLNAAFGSNATGTATITLDTSGMTGPNSGTATIRVEMNVTGLQDLSGISGAVHVAHIHGQFAGNANQPLAAQGDGPFFDGEGG
ncbi:MAG: hypothetical protein KDA55_16260, partial [Planctomycetales bacterium]|nr:hypothetical protein [Planctomycetales bacterium]